MEQEIEKKYRIWEDGKSFATQELLEQFGSIERLSEMVLRTGRPIRQGYLSLEVGYDLASKLGLKFNFTPVEARLRDDAGKLYFNMKGKGGLVRDQIPDRRINTAIFNDYWGQTQGKRVAKMRAAIDFRGFSNEFDVYTDRLLLTSEVEVKSESDVVRIVAPGEDITDNSSYKNKNLAR